MADVTMEVPLHGSELFAGDWWACFFPERPPSDLTCYEERCPRCVIKAQADLLVMGDRTMWGMDDHDEDESCLLSEIAAGKFLPDRAGEDGS